MRLLHKFYGDPAFQIRQSHNEFGGQRVAALNLTNTNLGRDLNVIGDADFSLASRNLQCTDEAC